MDRFHILMVLKVKPPIFSICNKLPKSAKLLLLKNVSTFWHVNYIQIQIFMYNRIASHCPLILWFFNFHFRKKISKNILRENYNFGMVLKGPFSNCGNLCPRSGLQLFWYKMFKSFPPLLVVFRLIKMYWNGRKIPALKTYTPMLSRKKIKCKFIKDCAFRKVCLTKNDCTHIY